MRYKVERKFKPKIPQLGTFVCKECGKSFESLYTYNRLVICSEDCRKIRLTRQHKAARQKHYWKNPRTPKERNCYLCNAAFTPRNHHDAEYCTPKCYSRARNMKANYGITVKKYHEMLIAQDGACAGCLQPFGTSTPHIDHDHTTGRIRGLLHGPCNSILGFVDDDSDKLIKLVNYLRSE